MVVLHIYYGQGHNYVSTISRILKEQASIMEAAFKAYLAIK